ncbi:hypothetical protein ACJMK2_037744 [Sinanodonta woodiana]|uniref:Mannan endo-1,4-beta-mannosidase n=1 Tax=Sinanodonta woodiana TaxID=1069815 RepID=A0ABD3WLD2_SINWO
MNGQRVFLSGINQAWVAYAYDFGNGQYQYRREVYERVIREMQESGGNSIRVWIHIEGETSPQFDGNGFVTGLDRDGTFISDMRQYIRFAGQHGILVFPTLWNAAVKQNYHHHLDGLVKSTAKLQSYIDNALIPMVIALKDEPGLGGWDIINEPEGEMISGEMNTDPCFDSRFLQNSGAGWAGRMYTIQEYLRFINWQVDAIRRTDPQAQVTAGSWSPISVTDNFGHRNIYKDQCLINAGGKQMGMLTFYSVHTYDWNGRYGLDAPFVNDVSAYGLDKPIVIAEFNQKSGGGMKLPQQFDYAYNHGYAGAWSWSYTDEDWNAQKSGMSTIKNNRNPTSGGLVKLPM